MNSKLPNTANQKSYAENVLTRRNYERLLAFLSNPLTARAIHAMQDANLSVLEMCRIYHTSPLNLESEWKSK